MLLFYTLMCRNYLEIHKNTKGALLKLDSDFSQICPPLQISEIVSFGHEEDVN